MTDEAHRPRLNIDLDEDTAPQIDAILTANLMESVSFLAGLDDCTAKQKELKGGIIDACEAYIQGYLEQQNQRSEKLDNEALDRVTRSSQALYNALLGLQDHPGLEHRLEQSIRQRPNLQSLTGNLDLSQIITKQRNIFADLREVLIDLQVCAENVINRQPKPVILEPIEDEDHPTQLDGADELAVRESEWRTRSQARKIPKDHALQEFLRTFSLVWEGLTSRPFTEGMHHLETGETASWLVDCVEVILRELDPRIQRQTIVTALRNIRRDC